jgi:hypothetical protein
MKKKPQRPPGRAFLKSDFTYLSSDRAWQLNFQHTPFARILIAHGRTITLFCAPVSYTNFGNRRSVHAAVCKICGCPASFVSSSSKLAILVVAVSIRFSVNGMGHLLEKIADRFGRQLLDSTHRCAFCRSITLLRAEGSLYHVAFFCLASVWLLSVLSRQQLRPSPHKEHGGGSALPLANKTRYRLSINICALLTALLVLHLCTTLGFITRACERFN